MTAQPIDSSFYADPQGLTALKREARAQSPEALRETAKQFESLFTSMLLKSMRAATPKDSLFGSDQQDFYQDMFDQQLSTQLSKGKGLGLADMLVQQLMRGGVTDEAAATPAVAPAASTSAAPGAAKPTAGTWPPATREDFVQALLPAATRVGEQLGVDPSTLIAHAALETGWGKSLPQTADGGCSYNLFGIKAGASWGGARVEAVTTEFAKGKAESQQAQFRAYSSPEECLQDYASLLGGNGRYAGALGTGSDAAAFAGALQRGGYATDPDYAQKLTHVARDLKLRMTLPITSGDAA
ncbi:MAG: glucosaminidase domain-containing protein [Pseudomonadota bacterium]